MSGATEAKPVVGFLGLGNMGRPMAANLVAAGYRVRGFDLVSESVASAAEHGVEPTASAADAVDGAGAVLTMLPSGKHVLAAYEGEDGVLARADRDALLIDCSTIDIASSRRFHEAVRGSGRDGVDAPVSGGVVGAERATLTFMVGGSDEAFARSHSILSTMGRTVVNCGGAGSGQAAKLCNNMILGVSMVAVSEAFVLAESLGLSHEALFAVASTSSGQCWALNTNCPVPGPVPTSPANNDYRAGFSAALMLKDLTLAHEAAEAENVPADLGRTAFELYSRYVAEADAGKDFSAIISWIRERRGLDPHEGER